MKILKYLHITLANSSLKSSLYVTVLTHIAGRLAALEEFSFLFECSNRHLGVTYYKKFAEFYGKCYPDKRLALKIFRSVNVFIIVNLEKIL